MLKKALLTLVITFCATFFIFYSDDDIDNSTTNEFVLTSLNNSQIVVKQNNNGFYIDKQKNKIVLFDIFATWCPPCQASASHLTSLQKKYKDDLIIIGITIEQPEYDEDDNIINAKLNKFKLKHNAKYTIVNSDQNKDLSTAITTILEMGPRYPIPTVAMYKNGEYINHYIGAVQEEFIESDIKRVLGK